MKKFFLLAVIIGIFVCSGGMEYSKTFAGPPASPLGPDLIEIKKNAPDGSNGQVLKMVAGEWAPAADSTGAGGDQLVDIVATSPLLVNATTNVDDALPGSDADITFSMPAATNASPGHATAAQITALEAVDTAAEIAALIDSEDITWTGTYDFTGATIDFTGGSIQFGLTDGDIPDLSATYEAVDAEIARMDTADTVGADWEWQDNISRSVGSDNDWEEYYDESGNDRWEFVHTAGAGADVYWDLNDNVADSTFTITNSDGTYEANLSVEGDITATKITADGGDGARYVTFLNNTSGNQPTTADINTGMYSYETNLYFVTNDSIHSMWDAATGDQYWYGATDGNGFEYHWDITDPTADRTVTLDNNSIDFSHTTEDYVLKYNASTRTWSGEADSTGSALGSNLSSSTDDILSDNGTILLGGTGNTNNETLDFDFETSANTVGVSTTSGVTLVDFGAIGIAGGSFDASDGNITNVGTISIDAISADATNVIFGSGAATQLQFRDSLIYIASLDDGHLDLEADTSVDINAPVVTNGALTIGGTLDLGAAALIDATGAVDIDVGSGDVTDVTVTTDGGTVVIDGLINIPASTSYQVAGTAILSDSAGTMTLSNVDALDATTETTIEAAIDTLGSLGAGGLADDTVLFADLDDDGNYGPFTGTWEWNSPFEFYSTTSGDQTIAAAQLGLKTDEDLIVTHGGANGEVQDEAGISLLQHIAYSFDPAYMYDQESTYRSVPIMVIGDDFPHGFTITEWSVAYVGGDPTTELDADLICDTTPDYNTAAGATVMDALDTTAGSSSADTGFDSATCANGSTLYIHFGADPTDDNVVVTFNLWGYTEED